MANGADPQKGYVYILEVRGMDLPVCKIGRTARTPEVRCEEINKSSTGDFLWRVAHFICTDDCRGLEALVHGKLEPLRQKGREFFHLRADEAFLALQSVVSSQSRISVVDEPVPEPIKAKKAQKNRRRVAVASSGHLDRRHSEYSEYLHIFTSVLNVKGRPFGQLNKPRFGMSDGNHGIQWNLVFTGGAGEMEVHLGVNLEGLKYHDWPIATLLLSELEAPSLEKLKSRIRDPGTLDIRFARDAWQAAARPEIEEQYIGGRIVNLAETDNRKWIQMVSEALTCLDSTKSYRGRARQSVTLVKQSKQGSPKRWMDVTPHLTIRCKVRLGRGFESELKRKHEEMKPVYDWFKEQSLA